MSQRRRGGRILTPGEARARGGLIVPGAARRGMQTLHVPRGYETQEEVVLVGTCSTCDRIFYRGEEDEWQRHVGWCAHQHLDDVLAARAEQKKRLAIFQEDFWDPEFAAYMKKVGNRMRAEGRLALKPNERSYE